MVTFTGSAGTAARLRVHPKLVRQSVPFTAEADSLNCAILGPDVKSEDPEFELFVKEMVREMTTKAGHKCTAIRRAIVTHRQMDAVAAALRARLSKMVVGAPSVEGVRMGALASKAQQADVAERVALLAQECEVLFGARDGFAPLGDGVAAGAFFAPTLLAVRSGSGTTVRDQRSHQAALAARGQRHSFFGVAIADQGAHQAEGFDVVPRCKKRRRILCASGSTTWPSATRC